MTRRHPIATVTPFCCETCLQPACRRIRHATHARYKLTRADAGHKLRVRVTAVDIAGSKTATSRASKRVPAVRKR